MLGDVELQHNGENKHGEKKKEEERNERVIEKYVDEYIDEKDRDDEDDDNESYYLSDSSSFANSFRANNVNSRTDHKRHHGQNSRHHQDRSSEESGLDAEDVISKIDYPKSVRSPLPCFCRSKNKNMLTAIIQINDKEYLDLLLLYGARVGEDQLPPCSQFHFEEVCQKSKRRINKLRNEMIKT